MFATVFELQLRDLEKLEAAAPAAGDLPARSRDEDGPRPEEPAAPSAAV